MDATLAVHIAESEDGSHSVIICVDGFDSEENAGEFARTFLLDGRLAVGDVEFVAGFDFESIH